MPKLSLRRRWNPVPHPFVLPLAALAAAALLAACGPPPPMKVAFPDDPRVLQGEWNVRVTGMNTEASSFVHAPLANRLVVWSYDGVAVYEQQPAGGWHAVARDFPASISASSYDRTLEAFVTPTLAGSAPRIRVTPVDGSPANDAPVLVPPGAAIEAVALGSGRTLALRAAESGGHELLWWDSQSGALGGRVPVMGVRDGMRVSANGRVIALWDLDTYRATLIDTGAAEPVARLLPLGVCRSNGPTVASDDGRWFVFGDCRGNLRVADLRRPELTSEAIGVKYRPGLHFGVGSAELAWVDDQGAVMSYDVAAGSRSELARLDATERDGLAAWMPGVYLNRHADLLALITGRGTVRVASLATAAGAAEVPTPALTLAGLDLTTRALAASAADYEFGGTFSVLAGVGAGEALPVSGSVYAHGLHEYVPGAGGLGTAVWLPSLHGRAAAVDADTGEERFTLDFTSFDKRAEAYGGQLHDVSAGVSYRVVVERRSAATQPARDLPSASPSGTGSHAVAQAPMPPSTGLSASPMGVRW